MHREDSSIFLLYIEPSKEKKSLEPTEDHIVDIVELAISKAKSGASNYSKIKEEEWFVENSGFRGMHRTECGQLSSSRDYLLENGMITNSLAPFYLKWYRQVIPEIEMEKVMKLVSFYEQH